MTNFFTLLNLDPHFAIDISVLEKNYLALQQQYHPDRFASASATERQAALHQSISLNEAYQTLKDPVLRAGYLLSLEGIRVNVDQSTVKPSQTVLMEVMEHREKLQEADTPDALRALQRELVGERMESLSKLTEYFAANDSQNAAQEAIRLRYISKTIEEIKLRKG